MTRICITLTVALLALPVLAQNKPTKPDTTNVISTRDPSALVSAMNKAWLDGLTKNNIKPSEIADDSEFLRRVYLDLTGRVPSVRQAREFLDNLDPNKRRNLVDDLCNVREFGQHLGISWRLWLDPPEDGGKPKPDFLKPWLALQFQKNRSWGDLVHEMLIVKGEIRNNAAMSFLIANSENFRPKPEMVADAVSRMFMGVELRCAQCHDHPFADWKQDEFWGVAAFFAKTHPSSFKGGPNVTLLDSEALPDGVKPDPNAKGAAVTIPAMSGPKSGQVVRARFPKGKHLTEDKEMPYRDHFADWLVAKDNPYFAKATVNRFWFLMFGRGLVNPLEGFDVKNPPANPELLALIAKEFAASDYDVKYLLRSICLSEAYQRTSKIVGKAENDESQLSRMAVKPFTPEMVYDSLAVVLLGDSNDKNNKNIKPMVKPGEKPMTIPGEKPINKSTTKPAEKPIETPTLKPGEKPMVKPGDAAAKTGDKTIPNRPRQPGELPFSRDEFVKYFRAKGGNIHASNQGIPQTLRLLNDPSIFTETPIVERLVSQSTGATEAIETLFLAAYSRKPTGTESALFAKYQSEAKDPRTGYSGMLWILVNSSEFLLNH